MPYPSKSVTVTADVAIAAAATDVTINVVASAGISVGDYLRTSYGAILRVDQVPGGTSIRVDHFKGDGGLVNLGAVLETPPLLMPDAEYTQGWGGRVLHYKDLMNGSVTPGITTASAYSLPFPTMASKAVFIFTAAAGNPSTGSRVHYRGYVVHTTTPKTATGSGSLLTDLNLGERVGAINWAAEGGGMIHAIFPLYPAATEHAGGYEGFIPVECMDVAVYTGIAVAVTRVDAFVLI